MKRVQALQAALKFSTSYDDIRNNHKMIIDETQYLDEQRKIVDALRRANQAMCTHINKVNYADARDGGGWDCPDCGAAQ